MSSQYCFILNQKRQMRKTNNLLASEKSQYLPAPDNIKALLQKSETGDWKTSGEKYMKYYTSYKERQKTE